MPACEDHWVIRGNRTCKYFSSGRTTLRAELHKFGWKGRVTVGLALFDCINIPSQSA